MANSGIVSKIKPGVLTSIGLRSFDAAKGGHYLEAFQLQNVYIDLNLRLLIARQKQDRRWKRFWDEENLFTGTLIDYLDLLGAPQNLVSEMRKYNTARRDVVHRTLAFKSLADLEKAAMNGYELGKQLDDKLDKYEYVLMSKFPFPSDKK